MAEGMMRIIHRVEGLPGGGWHTVNRVLLEDLGAIPLVCPNCGNDDQDKFETVASGNTLHGFVCLACTR